MNVLKDWGSAVVFLSGPLVRECLPSQSKTEIQSWSDSFSRWR